MGPGVGINASVGHIASMAKDIIFSIKDSGDVVVNKIEPMEPIGHFIELTHKSYQENERLKLANQILMDTINDFANYGTRHDINPTGQFMTCGCFNSFAGDHWQGYIRSQDQNIRERAKHALKQVDELPIPPNLT